MTTRTTVKKTPPQKRCHVCLHRIVPGREHGRYDGSILCPGCWLTLQPWERGIAPHPRLQKVGI